MGSTRCLKDNRIIKIRRYEPEDYAQVVALNKSILGSSKIARFHEWLYELNPATERDMITCWVAEDREIVGTISGMPNIMKVKDRSLRAIWAQNFAVKRDWQGLGIGRDLLRHLVQDCDIFLAIGGGPQSHALFLKEGCLDIYACYQAGLNLIGKKSMLKQLVTTVINGNLILSLGVLKGFWNNVDRGIPASKSVIETFYFDKRFDDLLERASREFPILTVRNSAYLNWRYKESPTDFTVISVESGDSIVGYMVLNVGCRGRDNGVIMDFLVCPCDTEVLRCLLLKAVDIFRAKKFRHINCIMPTNQKLANMFRDVGFFERDAASRLYLIVKPFSRSISSTLLRQPENWVVGMGESDLCL